MRAAVALAITVSLALAVAGSASATLRKLAFASTVSPSDYAVLTVAASPRARCAITVVYETTVSHAAGLGAKTGTRISWRWKVGSATHPGSWPVTVNCGKSGKLTLRLPVR
jgi:hypothetical protein